VVRGGLMHGKTSPVLHDGSGLIAGLPSPFTATRYHSLVVEGTPASLVVNATSTTPGLEGTSVMGFRHESLPIHGVQFHPESIATEHGHALLANFLAVCGIAARPLPDSVAA
jgi:anthranilate synthase component 2